MPISVKIEVLLTFPTIGIAVSKGWLATKLPDAEKGAGFVSARKGAVPVCVGPFDRELLLSSLIIGHHTCEDLGGDLKVIGRGSAGAHSCGLPPVYDSSLAENGQSQNND